MTANASSENETLRGVLDHITYHDEESGFTIARLVPEEDGAPAIIVGNFSALNLGETLEVRGTWTMHPQYGRQFRVAEYHTVLPSTVEGIRRYLGSGLIKGLGPVTADRIVEKFGDQTLEIIERFPGRLRQVEGLGPKRIRQIQEAWQAQRGIREVMVFLQQFGISTAWAHRIWRHYGPDSVAIVKHDPYRMAADIRGIGFRTADKIARQAGIAADDPHRLAAGIAWVVEQSTDQGHTYLPGDDLVSQAVEQLGVPSPAVEDALDATVNTGTVVREGDRIALPELAAAEGEIADRIVALLRAHAGKKPDLVVAAETDEALIARVTERTGLAYAPQQRAAIVAALREGVLVLTGGPGTGKTTTVQGIIGEIRARGQSLALCAPTGRAAKRLSEVTRVEACTIHRLLGYQPDRHEFQYNEQKPLAADVVLVDESSMIDTVLFASLLRAVRPGSRLVLVGDADQLPSVGPGQVLRDVIASNVVPVVRLATVFRQAQASQIITNAHLINAGEMPSLANEKNGDFFFLSETDPDKAATLVCDLVTRRLPSSYRVDPVADIQVLTPMYRGETGAIELNKRLQQAINPNGVALGRGTHEFRAGDKIIVTRNNYAKMVFNGDIGRIVSIDVEQGAVVVELGSDGDPVSVVYEQDELDELALAYAISVHRSQGSEFPIVVMPVTTQHYVMLQRNVLYTAVTRAKRLMVLVGAPRALAIAARNAAVSERYTWLAERLRVAMKA